MQDRLLRSSYFIMPRSFTARNDVGWRIGGIEAWQLLNLSAYKPKRKLGKAPAQHVVASEGLRANRSPSTIPFSQFHAIIIL